MDIAITRMSSKGQIVLPIEMRSDIKEGEKLLIIRNEGNIILKRASKLDVQLEEDLAFGRKTEEAWKRLAAGEGVTMEFDAFIKELSRW